MRVGIVTTWFERGAAYVSLQYANKLRSEGVEVFIYARGGYDDSFNKLFPVEIDKDHNLIVRSALNMSHYKKWLIDNDLTHVLFNEQFWWQPIILTKKMNIKCLAYIDYYTKASIPLFKIYDKLICNTKRHYSVFEKLGNAVYIPWGTDVNLYTPKEKNYEQTVFFHSVGWSPFRKGTDFLLEAASKINDDFRLIIHSQIDLAQSLPKHKQIIINLLNSGKLELIDKTVEAPGLYHLGNVYVYPSRLEGIGLSIAEALSCGLPTIVPDNGPMNEFIDEQTCKTILIKEFKTREDNYFWPMCFVDVDDLVKKMKYYIDNKENLSKLSMQTRKHAIKKLDWNINAKELLSVFTSTKNQKLNNKILVAAKTNDNKIMRLSLIYNSSPNLYRILVKLYKLLVLK